MNKKVYTILHFAKIVIFFLAIALCVYVFCFGNNEKTRIESSGNIYATETLTINSAEEVMLPYSVAGEKGKSFELSCTLPDNIKENMCLTFRSLYCANEVYVDGKLIGSYGTKLPLSFGRMTGNIRVIVPLDPQASGKELSVIVTPYYTISMDLSSFEIGYTDEIKREILNDNLFRLIVCVVLLTIMFMAVGIMFYQIRTKAFDNFKLVSGFIFFDLFVVLWIVCSSDIPQFFTNCNEGISLVSFLSLAVLCIPLMSMCEAIYPDKARFFKIIGYVGWILPMIIGFCFVTRIADPMEILPLTHIYIIASIVLIFIFAVMEWKKGFSSKILLFGMIEIAVFAVIGLTCWFIAPSKGYDASVFGVGFIFFISTLFVLIGYTQIKVVEEKKSMDIYKRLAYMDSLTALKNRAAFELRFAQMQENNYKDILVSLFMFDLNNLKKTNDTLGHQAGDKLIVGAGRTITKVFGNIGECYRLGGDEFAVVLTGYEGSLSDLKDRFNKELQKYGKENDAAVSCAVGYASLKWNPGDTFYRDIYKIADGEMYADKIRTKHGSDEQLAKGE